MLRLTPDVCREEPRGALAAAKTLYEARGWKLDAAFDQYERFF